MKLEEPIFKTVIEHTPLISIDLIVTDKQDRVLLGWRQNAPAKHTWFTPGGRICKDETLGEAFRRISLEETGSEAVIGMAIFAGVYEHIYPHDNFFSDPAFGTHYIVLAYCIRADIPITGLPKQQHHQYKWFTKAEILQDPDVHRNVKNYFAADK